MKKTLAILFFTTLAFVVPLSLFADYDRDAVVKVMKVNLTQVGIIKKSLDSKDFTAAAGAFKEIVKAAQPMKKLTPKRGTKADWDKVWDDFIEAAQKGEKAAVAKDITKVKAQFDELMVLNKKGHSAFK